MALFKLSQSRGETSAALDIRVLPVFVIFLGAVLLLTIMVLILAALVGFRLGNAALRSNPFAAYEGLWPGQSIESVAAYARQTADTFVTCYVSHSLDKDYPGLVIYTAPAAMDQLDQTMGCAQSPHDGVFRAVNMTVTDERVQELTLLSDRLQENTLLLYWGQPDAITRIGNTQGFWLRWIRHTYWATAMVEPALPGAVVKILTITARQ